MQDIVSTLRNKQPDAEVVWLSENLTEPLNLSLHHREFFLVNIL